MRRRSLVGFLLVALLLPSAAAWAEVKVFFSPQGGCDRALIELAHTSRTYLYAACYTFSLDSVADELIAAKRRGVKVLVILDRRQAGQTWCPAPRLAVAGIPVKVNSHGGLMHDKFLVADGRSVATGSFNWTKAATQENDENLVIFTDEAPVARTFATQFERMWQDTTRFAALRSPPAGEVAPAQAAPSPGGYVASRNSRVYHRPECSAAARIKPGNLVTFKTKAEAEASGRRPCKVCKP